MQKVNIRRGLSYDTTEAAKEFFLKCQAPDVVGGQKRQAYETSTLQQLELYEAPKKQKLDKQPTELKSKKRIAFSMSLEE